MRLLILVPQVPETLSEESPWHFFQEVRPLSEAGCEIKIVNGVKPDYQIRDVEIEKLEVGRLSLATLLARMPWSALRYIDPLPKPRTKKDLRSLAILLMMTREIYENIREFEPDIIHSHWAYPRGSAGYLAAIATKTPLVMSLRGHEHNKSGRMQYGSCLNRFYERTLTLALRHSSRITICCSDSLRRVEELDVASVSKCRWVYHAVNRDRFKFEPLVAAKLKDTYGLQGRRVIGCIAILDHEIKGHKTLILAFAKLLATHPDAVLMLVGDGPLRANLEALVENLGIGKSVMFIGSIHPEEVKDYISLSDLTVLPTHCEVFGNVVFESLVMGVPVISGSAGAAKDVLPKGPYGLVFKSGSVSECCSSMMKILDNYRIYKDYATAGQQFVLREMSLEKRVQGLLSVYSECLNFIPAMRN